MKNLFCLPLLFALQVSFSQDHLEPERGVFELSSYKFGYHGIFMDSLTKGISDIALVRVICIPFGAQEWLLSIDKKGDQYFVSTVTPEKGIGFSVVEYPQDKVQRISAANFIRHHRKIDYQVAEKVCTIYQTMTAGTHYSNENRRGPDGANYHFITVQRWIGVRSGTTWSPAPGSQAGKLVALSKTLFEYASSTPAAQSEKLAQIDMLIKSF